MYMRVQFNFAKSSKVRDHVDVSRYTGMEIEHGINTNNMWQMSNASNLGHFDPHAKQQSNSGEFRQNIEKELSGLRKVAL